MTEPPVFLYNDPHPVHGAIANELDAKWIPAEKSGLRKRLKAANRRKINRPILIEGGVPLVQNAFGKLLHNYQGPSILLAADETQHNIHRRLPYYSRRERWAHRVAHRFLDGAIAVSGDIARWCRRLINGPVRLAFPFILQERYEILRELEPDLDSNRLVCVGEYRPANNQDVLAEAVESMDGDWEGVFIGENTQRMDTYEQSVSLGYVRDHDLYREMENASLMVFPAVAGAFPVSVLEGMVAGLPVITTPAVGVRNLVSEAGRQWMVRPPIVDVLAKGLERYGKKSMKKRERMSEKARTVTSGFQEAERLPRFKQSYRDIMEEL